MKIEKLKYRASQLAAILTAPLSAAGDDWLGADQRKRYEDELDTLRADIEAEEIADRKRWETNNGL